MDYKKDFIVVDLETPKGCFLMCVYEIENDLYKSFQINKYKNELYSIIKYLESNKDKYHVTFNGIGFDGVVIEFIWRNYEKWADFTGKEIAALIWQYAQDVIENSEYNIKQLYQEKDFSFKQIDIPRIFHWFNENRRVSLKQLEFELRAETIENFDIPHTKEDFSEEDVENLIYYCFNDCKYTYEAFKYAIGQTEHELYKGKDKIADRITIKNEFGLDCLNWDDVKIGAEWNKQDYIKLTGKKEWELKPKETNSFYGKKYKLFFPNTIEYKTKEVRDFVTSIGETFIKPYEIVIRNGKKRKKKQEFIYEFSKNLKICIARGGIHSQEKFRWLEANDNQRFIQNDIGSQYPNALRKYGVFPSHLGKAWNEMLVSKIQRRLDFKKLFKETKDPKYGSLQEMGKDALNGGAYGRLNTKGDWQEDPSALLKITIGCQLEILMIIEALIKENFTITSCNTDGWDAIIPINREKEYFDIVKFYESKIGNSEIGNVEFTQFEWMAQTSVNDYIAKKIGDLSYENGKVHLKESISYKLKGDFEYPKLLHKNTSFSIIPKALYQYFVNDIRPEIFIPENSDIFDFCARSNSGSTYYHKGYTGTSIESFDLPKLIRYYVAKEGIIIKKEVKEDVDTDANDTNVQPAEKPKMVCNRLLKSEQGEHLKNVDYQWYINKTNEIISSIEKGRKPKNKIINPNQFSLF